MALAPAVIQTAFPREPCPASEDCCGESAGGIVAAGVKSARVDSELDLV